MKKQNGFLKAFSKFSVSKRGWVWSIAPALIIVIALIVIIAIGASTGNYSNGVGIGIDFEGGTVLTVTLGDQAIDNYSENVEKITKEIEKHGVTVSYIQQQEASNRAQSSIAFRYKNPSEDYQSLNEEIKLAVEDMYADSGIASFAVYSETIGATAASDLLSKAAIALTVSTLLILIYIMIRFTFVSAIAAIVALLHDVVIMFCLTVICRIQINSYYVAAMITIIAYSINNTIIIFDRCREYVKPLKGQKNVDYNGIGDRSVRENMSRSIYTTATTMITIIFLAALGSQSIQEFCVPIIFGLLAGLYSSVFLATPLWAAMSYSFDKTKAKYSKRHNVVYEKKEDEEEDLSVPAKTKSDDDDEGFAPKQVKTAGGKPDKQNNNKVYKYSKKNTTFKKKK